MPDSVLYRISLLDQRALLPNPYICLNENDGSSPRFHRFHTLNNAGQKRESCLLQHLSPAQPVAVQKPQPHRQGSTPQATSTIRTRVQKLERGVVLLINLSDDQLAALQKEVVKPAVHRPRGLHASRGKCRRDVAVCLQRSWSSTEEEKTVCEVFVEEDNCHAAFPNVMAALSVLTI